MAKTGSFHDHASGVLPVIPGKWVWKDETDTLEFLSNNPMADKDKRKRAKEGNKRADRVASSVTKSHGLRGRSQRGNHPKSPHAPIKQTSEHSTVTLEDIKGVALTTISDGDNLTETFEGIFNTDPFDNFLLQLLCYFHSFFDKLHQEHKINTTTYIEPSKSEKEAFEVACGKLKVSHKLLGQSYCMLVLGLGLESQHHMACGQSRVSSTLKDRSMFEILYSFCTYFVWIAFRKKEYDNIRKEVGRLLRSDTFNPAIRVKNAPDEKEIKEKKDKENKEEKKLSPAEYRRLHPKRPAIKSIIHQRSPAIVAILPSPKEESHWLFRMRNTLPPKELEKIGQEDPNEPVQEEEEVFYLNKRNLKVGILGEPLAQFNLQTLSPLGAENEDEENEEGEKQPATEEQTTENPPPEQRISRQQTSISTATVDAEES